MKYRVNIKANYILNMGIKCTFLQKSNYLVTCTVCSERDLINHYMHSFPFISQMIWREV